MRAAHKRALCLSLGLTLVLSVGLSGSVTAGEQSLLSWLGQWLAVANRLDLRSTALAAATISVDSTAQEVTLTSPNGITNGNCTLGEAILAANSGAMVDNCNPTGGAPYTIDLDGAQTYILTARADNTYGPN